MDADEVVKIGPPNICECGGEIVICEKPYIHQKVDTPEIKPYVVEYQLEYGRCKKCGKRRSSKLPEGVTADTFGPKVKSVIGALRRMMWKFLDDPENIPLTNNHAERQIRHIVVYRKNSYFT